LYSSLNKEYQKKLPIQIPYHIKVSLQEYYENFHAWVIPDFSDKCPICGSVDCATFLGYYTRTAICPITGFCVPDLSILRYLCHDKGDARVCDHITFSLLPHQLVPFRQLTLDFMVKAIWLKVSQNLSLTRAMDVIEKKLNKLDDVADFINISTILSWQQMILTAFTLFTCDLQVLTDINMVSKSQYEQLHDIAELHLFLKILAQYDSCKTQFSYPVRGPDAFAIDYFQQFNVFLFGKSSQHRG